MESTNTLQKIKALKASIKTELGNRTVAPRKVETTGKTLYKLAKVFSQIERNA